MSVSLVSRVWFRRSSTARRAYGAQAWQALEGRVLMSVGVPPAVAAGHPVPTGIALIDATLPDTALLANSLPADVQPILYDPAAQSPQQVLHLAATTAQGWGTPLRSLMIFSHGSAGAFALGNGVVTADDLGQTDAGWKALAGRFADGASIDLYACDAAAGPRGQALLDEIHAATGAAVLGSTDVTGRDGNWTLEARSHEASHGSPPAVAAPALAPTVNAYPGDLLLSVSTPPAANPNPVTGTTAALSVAFLDVGGTAPTITWSATAKPTGGAVSFSVNGTTSASNTVVTFNKAGSYTLNVNAYDPVLNVSLGSSLTVTVNQTLSGVSVTPGSTTLPLNGTQAFAATALDQFGSAMATQPAFTWAKTGVGTVSAAGLYTAPASAGSATVTATTAGVSGSATVTVAATGPTVATPAAASPSTVTGTSTALSVLGADTTTGEAGLTYTWAATTKPVGSTVALSANGTNGAKNTTVTFNQPGVYVMTATIGDGTYAVTSATTITVTASLNAIAVAPATTTVNQNAAQQFTAVGYDQFGNPLATQPTFTWTTAGGSIGSVSSGGLYTAPASTGTATVQASSGGVTGAATVAVVNAAPTVATPAAASAVSALNTATLSVLGADDAGESHLTYAWAVTAGPSGGTPTFAVNGTNGAKNTVVTFNKTGTYTLAATITDAQGLPTTSGVTVTVAPVGTTLTLSPAGTVNLNENGTQLLTATVLDQFGAALPVQPAITYSVTSGGGAVSTGGLFTAPATTGTSVVHVASGLLGADITVNVTNAAPTVVTPATASPAVVTGTTANLATLGADDGGEANLTYTWSATVVPAGGGVTFSASGTNAAKATTATFAAAGLYTVQATISDGAHTTTTSTVVTVAQTLTAITVTPATAPLHENGVQQFTAVGTDQFANAMLVPPTFAWAKVSGIGSVTAGGLYTAPGSAGTATVEASAGAVHGSATVAVTNAAPVVAAPVATPATVVGTTAALTVAATDDGGPTNLTYTWTATAKPAGSSPAFGVNGTSAAAATAVTFDAAGSYTFAVAVSDGANTTTRTVAVTVAQTMAAITVTAPTTTAPENGGVQLTATALDQFGTALAAQPPFTWSATGAGAAVSASGLLTSGPLPGLDVVTAAVNGSPITGAATITVTNAAPVVTQPAAAGQAIVTGTATTLSVLAADDGGEANLTYAWAATVAPAGSHPAFSATGTNAAKTATVTFDLPGTYVLTATVSDGANTTTSSVPVTVVQTLSGVAVTPATTSVNLNAVQQFNAVGADQFGHAMLVQPVFAWADAGAGTVTATGLYASGTTPGSSTVTASSGGVSGSATVAVTDAAPTIVAPATAAATTLGGTSTTLAVLGADDGGESHLTYTWSATTAPAGAAVAFDRNGTNAAKAATATFDRAGTYVLTAAVSDGASTASSSVTVTVTQSVAAVAVTPGTASVNLNGQQQFAAAATDQFGQPMAVAPAFAWSVLGVGGVDATGLFTAGILPGSATVTATAPNGVTGTAGVAMTNAAPTVATAAAASASPVVGTTVNLTALGADDAGAANLTYTWAATSVPAGASPLFWSNGTRAARNDTVTFDRAGTYTFAVTIADAGGLTATSSVTVAVQQTLTSVAVSPAVTMTSLGTTQQFTAVAADQFGRPLSAQPAVAWAVASGSGSVDGTGLYTAPNTVGLATVTATAGGVTGTAAVQTIASAAIWSNVSAAGTSADLAVAGLGDPSLAVTWTPAGGPAGAAAPTFSVNGTSAAQHTTATFTAAGTYTLQAAVNGSTLTTTVVVAQQLASLAVSPASPTMNERQTQPFAAIGYDQFAAPMLVQPAVTWSVAVGSGSVDALGVYRSPAVAGTEQVTATSGSVMGTATVTVVNAAPTVAVPPVAVTNPVLTTTAALSVLGADDGGESNLTYTWSPVGGGNPAPVTLTANGDNASKNTTATFTRAGNYAFNVAVSDGTTTTTSGTITVVVTPVLTQLTLGPASASLNENGTVQFAAAAADQFGDPMPVLPAVSFAVTAGGGSIDPATGVYTAPAVPGTATITATTGAMQSTATVTVSNALPTLTQPAAAGASVVTGTGTTLGVLATDDGGAAGLTYTWSVAGGPAGASPTFTANGTAAASNTAVTFDAAGSYLLLATISDGTSTITSTVPVTVQQTLTTIGVSPAVASLNENATQPFAATGYDQFGDPLATPPAVTWDVPTGVGSIDAAGTYTAGGQPGVAVVRATSGAVAGVAAVTVTNAAPTIATAASASPGTVTGTTAALSVLGADDGGAAGLTYTWAATAAPAGGHVTFAANGTNAAAADVATFDKAGTYALAVTVGDGSATAVSTVNVTVAQTLSDLQLAPPAGTTVDENAPLQFTAVGLDQFGDATITPPAVTWAVSNGGGTVDGSGLFTAGGATGSSTVTATAPGGVTRTITVVTQDALPTLAAAAAASPADVTGTTTSLSALGADDGGEANLTYTWAVTAAPAGASPVFSANGTNGAKDTAVTFDAAGAYTFAVTISDGTHLLTSSVPVTVEQTLASIAVTPASAGLNANGTQQFAAVALDRFGDPLGVQPAVTWSTVAGGGTVDANGLYTAPPGSGSATVQASVGGLVGQANVSINYAPPTVAVAAAASPAVVAGTTTQLSVLGASPAGEGTLSYTWAVLSAPAGATPTFSANGTNGAKDTAVTFDAAGTYTFAVSVSDGVEVTTSPVTVTVAQTFAGLTVTPPTTLVHAGGIMQFTAVADDQFGDPMAAQPTVAWTVASGGGTIDANGLYTAPTAEGTATVTASAGGLSTDVPLTVTRAVPAIGRPASATTAAVTGTTAALSVVGADAAGESFLTYTWAATAAPAGATTTFNVNGTNAAKNATVTFDRPGAYTFAVAVSDGTQIVTSSATVTVAATATSVAVTPAVDQLNDGQSQPFTATVDDQFGQPMPSASAITWTLADGNGSIDAATGLYTAAGPDGHTTVRATAGVATGTATVTVLGAAPTVAAAPTANPSPVYGTGTTLHALGAAATGEPSLTYTWALAAGPDGAQPAFASNGTNAAKDTAVTFDTAGTYTFAVTVSDGIQATTATVGVTVVQVLTSLSISPGVASLNTYQPQPFTAEGYDQFGDVLAAQPRLFWAVEDGVGTVNSGGLYTSATAGPATVVATTGSVAAAATVTVADVAPTITAPARADDPVVTATSTGLHVDAQDQGIAAADLTYVWTQMSGPEAAAFSDNDSGTAKDTTVQFFHVGAYTFQVTVTAPNGLTATDTVSVQVTPTLTTLTAVVHPDTIVGTGTSQATAGGLDQFGDAMATPAVTWSADAGSVGTVDPTSGLYDDRADNGTATVRATAGGLTATAVVTSTGNAASPLTVKATADQPSADSGAGMLYANGVVADPAAPVTYTWSIVDQPTAGGVTVRSPRKHAVSAAAPTGGPMAVFAKINGTAAAVNCPVTYLAAGTYTFRVTAQDGLHTVADDVQVTVVNAAADPAITTVSGLHPIVTNDRLTGYAVTFNNPLDPATANDVRGYRLVQRTNVAYGRNFVQHLFGVHTKSRRATRPLKIATATYDPATLTVTLTLAKPAPLATAALTLKVLGNGPHAVMAADGRRVDGNNDDAAGGNFAFTTKTFDTRGGSYTYADGDVGTLRLVGPGEMTIVLRGKTQAPIIYLRDCDPATSVLVGNVRKGKHGTGTKSIRSIINSASATVRLGTGFVVDDYQ